MSIGNVSRQPEEPLFISSTGNAQEHFAWLKAQTRRHFLITCATGLGAMFLGMAQAEEPTADDAVSLDFTRDPVAPLAPLPPQFAPGHVGLYICIWLGRRVNSNSSTTNHS